MGTALALQNDLQYVTRVNVSDQLTDNVGSFHFQHITQFLTV